MIWEIGRVAVHHPEAGDVGRPGIEGGGSGGLIVNSYVLIDY
jgi:hypothetical protein